jgi:anthranilate phosphoribosyltransferase
MMAANSRSPLRGNAAFAIHRASSYARLVLAELTQQLADSANLTPEQILHAFAALTDEAVTVEAKADFLVALAKKGETAEEIAGFAKELRAVSIQPPISEALRQRDILDVCGTGGDQLNTFNISTTVALVAAAAGVVVAKHGNRAITSQSGSADVLEALGIRIDLSPADAASALERHGFAFFFAPNFHPAFKHIGPVRKLCAQRGQRTIFNFLGPLLNPARPTVQLLGVSRPELCEPLALVLQKLGLRRAMVVSGSVVEVDLVRSLDELSTLGPSRIAEFHHDRAFHASDFDPAMLPIRKATLADLKGGDKLANAEIIRRILRGEDRGPCRDAVLLNSAAALFVAGKSKSLTEGWTLAEQTIDSGAATRKLGELAA